jgi:hypothetical protein
MAKCIHHAVQPALGLLARQCGHQTDDPRHGVRIRS